MDDSSGADSVLTVGVPREIAPGERRVALVPDSVGKLTASGLRILVQAGAGEEASFVDGAYGDVGATIVPMAEDVYRGADIVVKVQAPRPDEMTLLHDGQVLIGFLDPLRNRTLIDQLAAQGVSAIAVEAIPRITRAQSMDALSSMSTLAGYKAVLLAANALGRIFPMLMTAAGTLTPARVLVLGAGVAGLQALATARRLGAVTSAFDVRAAAREQVQSVGATFIELPPEIEEGEGEGGYAKELSAESYRHEQETLRPHVTQTDVVITTALIPGKPAPLLITADMVSEMRPGAVIVDLAAEQGGNCELTVAGEVVTVHGVTMLGPLNIPSSLPVHASQMYSRNVTSLLGLIVKDGQLNLNFEDEIIRAACVSRPSQVAAS